MGRFAIGAFGTDPFGNGNSGSSYFGKGEFGVGSGGIGGIDAFTKLMLHMDDVPLSDSEITPKTVTKVGDVARSATQSVFGGFSAVFDGSGDELTIGDSADFFFDTGALTIDLRAFFNSFTGSPSVFYQDSAGPIIHACQIDSANINWLVYTGSFILNMNVAHGMTTGQFYHLAFIRGWGGNANDFAICVNGSRVGAVTTASISIPDLTSSWRIGTYGGSQYLNGYIDEYRVSKGIARWTANFRVPTAPYSK